MEEYEKKAYQVLKLLGCNQSYSGFNHAMFAVAMLLENPEIHDYTGENGIYTKIAEHYHKQSWTAVERSIRHLIQNFCQNASLEKCDKVFGEEVTESTINSGKNLSNKQFLESICNYIRYDFKPEE